MISTSVKFGYVMTYSLWPRNGSAKGHRSPSCQTLTNGCRTFYSFVGIFYTGQLILPHSNVM